MSAQQYGMDPNEFAQNIDQQGQVPAMVAEVARRKALAYVLEQASVVDSDGTVIDLDAAVPQNESEAEGDAESEFDTEVVEVTAEDAPADEGATAKA
jgi:trigger factor